MFEKLLFYSLLVITFDACMYFFGNKKYKSHLELKHYISTLKIPIYQKILIMKILIVQVLVIIFSIISI
ncbi:hypothetical protein SAMN02745174_02597 [Cetobacterium ceti]|uniref:Uncharacterized protein n=1 Tax=Cetobacterium ceti TaxID=180163 RepID=A0A1T4R6T5_9FUSO|nr:hypothetical protein SAMN02745174_02597 [Cetobacterium ceti]